MSYPLSLLKRLGMLPDDEEPEMIDSISGEPAYPRPVRPDFGMPYPDADAAPNIPPRPAAPSARPNLGMNMYPASPVRLPGNAPDLMGKPRIPYVPPPPPMPLPPNMETGNLPTTPTRDPLRELGQIPMRPQAIRRRGAGEQARAELGEQKKRGVGGVIKDIFTGLAGGGPFGAILGGLKGGDWRYQNEMERRKAEIGESDAAERQAQEDELKRKAIDDEERRRNQQDTRLASSDELDRLYKQAQIRKMEADANKTMAAAQPKPPTPPKPLNRQQAIDYLTASGEWQPQKNKQWTDRASEIRRNWPRLLPEQPEDPVTNPPIDPKTRQPIGEGQIDLLIREQLKRENVQPETSIEQDQKMRGRIFQLTTQGVPSTSPEVQTSQSAGSPAVEGAAPGWFNQGGIAIEDRGQMNPEALPAPQIQRQPARHTDIAKYQEQYRQAATPEQKQALLQLWQKKFSGEPPAPPAPQTPGMRLGESYSPTTRDRTPRRPENVQRQPAPVPDLPTETPTGKISLAPSAAPQPPQRSMTPPNVSGDTTTAIRDYQDRFAALARQYGGSYSVPDEAKQALIQEIAQKYGVPPETFDPLSKKIWGTMTNWLKPSEQYQQNAPAYYRSVRPPR